MGKKLDWSDLTHGKEIEAFWHYNSLSFVFFWKPGKVHCLIGGGKKFIPDDGLGAHMLFPHRMDEVRPITVKED